MKFIADMMLGRLARWLRLYGYDTVYGINDDDEILNIARKENRVILSRDLELVRRARKLGIEAIFIKSNSLEEQVSQLMHLGVSFDELFPENARCPKCNGRIIRVDKEHVKGKVPEAVYNAYEEFYVCTNCGQIYWPGRQWREMLKMDKKFKTNRP
ncbi:hypothetical protein PNA2_1380 [Pyrococcus sp. NA2]|uniref:Mut7-C RNAse domain-containing protein n=1 Tax=Pyrococcus sp. (strain NA2) TaxID=342949 RepID=UPI000209AE98|nr:DUF5615 family PIN-like protein [Pyrococcus sp. NA2]AEC52294.1 hypothetical protein PNA2_1380 [Pyrococcus sp. NA2]